MKRVRAELNSGANFTELGCLLQNERSESFLRQSQRKRQAAYAAARDDYSRALGTSHGYWPVSHITAWPRAAAFAPKTVLANSAAIA